MTLRQFGHIWSESRQRHGHSSGRYRPGTGPLGIDLAALPAHLSTSTHFKHFGASCPIPFALDKNSKGDNKEDDKYLSRTWSLSSHFILNPRYTEVTLEGIKRIFLPLVLPRDSETFLINLNPLFIVFCPKIIAYCSVSKDIKRALRTLIPFHNLQSMGFPDISDVYISRYIWAVPPPTFGTNEKKFGSF